MHNYNKQQGGTILGIIVGLVIGLGIALAVALVITKTPMPFTDKSGRQKAGELTAGQAADPNKPLYGKDVARESLAREVAPPINTAAPPMTDTASKTGIIPQPVPQPVPQPGENRAPVVDKSSTADKLGMAAPTSPAKPEKAEDKWIYFLQAGAFRERADAEGMRAKLALSGVEARISERQSESGVLYRVRVGPFPDLDSMNNVRGKLSDGGIDAAVVRAAK